MLSKQNYSFYDREDKKKTYQLQKKTSLEKFKINQLKKWNLNKSQIFS